MFTLQSTDSRLKPAIFSILLKNETPRQLQASTYLTTWNYERPLEYTFPNLPTVIDFCIYAANFYVQEFRLRLKRSLYDARL